MTETSPRGAAAITGWHAHVYYDPATTRDRAARLREWVGERFDARLGHWHDASVGPHTQAMYQIAFPAELFATLVPFLALNRLGLSILVHPETDDPYADHLEHALWLGPALPINGEALRPSSGGGAARG
jgi:DOPA 4,5-dioxygenase